MLRLSTERRNVPLCICSDLLGMLQLGAECANIRQDRRLSPAAAIRRLLCLLQPGLKFPAGCLQLLDSLTSSEAVLLDLLTPTHQRRDRLSRHIDLVGSLSLRPQTRRRHARN